MLENIILGWEDRSHKLIIEVKIWLDREEKDFIGKGKTMKK